MYDIAIIGGGPAGVSAALNCAILEKKFIWFGSREISKKVASAELIRNYPGLPNVTGVELVSAFKKHLDLMGIESTDKVVTGVYDVGGKFSLTAGDETFDARAVILCTGVTASGLIDGEEKFLGRGISYCATCDGFLYKGKTVAVVCTDKRFEHEIEFLCNLAEKSYVMPLYRGYRTDYKNAEILLKPPIAFKGESKVTEAVFKDGTISVDGIFILRGTVSPSVLVQGLATEGGHITVNRDLATNIPGVFAAGDCTGRPYQYVKAAGEGNVAAHSAVEYLAAHPVNEE